MCDWLRYIALLVVDQASLVREGTRAAVTLFLEAADLSRTLEDSSSKEDSKYKWEDHHFFSGAIEGSLLAEADSF